MNYNYLVAKQETIETYPFLHQLLDCILGIISFPFRMIGSRFGREFTLHRTVVHLPYLTGESEEIPSSKTLAEEAKFNVKFAKKIITSVRKMVLFCENFPESCVKHRSLSDPKARKKVNEKLSQKRKQLEKGIEYRFSNEKLQRILSFQLGNCEEMAFVGYAYALSQGRSAEIFNIGNGDHYFLVIGRDPTSNPHDYKKWGKDSMICDPWAQAVYPSSKLEIYLQDYVKYITTPDERRLPHILPFNPLLQCVEINHVIRDKSE